MSEQKVKFVDLSKMEALEVEEVEEVEELSIDNNNKEGVDESCCEIEEVKMDDLMKSSAQVCPVCPGKGGLTPMSSSDSALSKEKLVDWKITDQNSAFTVVINFLIAAQSRGAFSLDESAKLFECIRLFGTLDKQEKGETSV